jgi:hypothetical protein
MEPVALLGGMPHVLHLWSPGWCLPLDRGMVPQHSLSLPTQEHLLDADTALEIELWAAALPNATQPLLPTAAAGPPPPCPEPQESRAPAACRPVLATGCPLSTARTHAGVAGKATHGSSKSGGGLALSPPTWPLSEDVPCKAVPM